MDELGRVEDEIFRRRHANELNFRAREKAKKKPQQRPNFQMLNNTQFAPWILTVNHLNRVMGCCVQQEQTSGRGRKRTAAEAGLDEDEDAHDEGCASWKWYFPTTTRPSPPTSSTWRLSRTSRRGPYRNTYCPPVSLQVRDFIDLLPFPRTTQHPRARSFLRIDGQQSYEFVLGLYKAPAGTARADRQGAEIPYRCEE
ncbi:hypothetical protein MSG28_001126 [Choristoneura fumiferana]|uniref:Uncharacterized protein n=1 Tax=Choristoneura fumiferana TaxID=7141 RepID=A0ACC0K494_CHOFU|nr:hypothetical protein MSG28_001126 [Choristoneura fumiferana]